MSRPPEDNELQIISANWFVVSSITFHCRGERATAKRWLQRFQCCPRYRYLVLLLKDPALGVTGLGENFSFHLKRKFLIELLEHFPVVNSSATGCSTQSVCKTHEVFGGSEGVSMFVWPNMSESRPATTASKWIYAHISLVMGSNSGGHQLTLFIQAPAGSILS